MKRIVFATGNKNKLEEIREIFRGTGLEVVSMKDAGADIDIIEDGQTFAENAAIKARAVWQVCGGIVMADDSGLVVDCLGGEPGVYSARYLGEATGYDVKNAEIIRRVNECCAGQDDSARSARFTCVIACVLPDGRLLETTGHMEGQIAYEPAGEHGFGYDPILYLPGKGCTSAQLDMDDKNAISHRGEALRRMRAELLREGMI